MNTEDYLNRIGYQGDLTPDLEVLQRLQRCHLLNVPFENLDIHYGIPIELDINKFYDKVVGQKRGGFCYELNGLFQSLLRQLGFESKMISARVYNGEQETFGAEYDHLAIMVSLDDTDYLVDVGFGEFAFHPLKIELDTIQSDPRGNYIIEAFENEYHKVSKVEGQMKTIQYIFTTKARVLSEFAGMCEYHQKSPHSHFTQKRLISIPTEIGRITMTGNTIKVTEKGKIVKEHPFAEEEYGKQLLQSFNIDESKIRNG